MNFAFSIRACTPSVYLSVYPFCHTLLHTHTHTHTHTLSLSLSLSRIRKFAKGIKNCNYVQLNTEGIFRQGIIGDPVMAIKRARTITHACVSV